MLRNSQLCLFPSEICGAGLSAEASVVAEDKTVQAAFWLFWKSCLFFNSTNQLHLLIPDCTLSHSSGCFEHTHFSSFFCWWLASSSLSLFVQFWFCFFTSFCLPVLWAHLSRAHRSLDCMWVQLSARKDNWSLQCVRLPEPGMLSAVGSFPVGACRQRAWSDGWRRRSTSTPPRLRAPLLSAPLHP